MRFRLALMAGCMRRRVVAVVAFKWMCTTLRALIRGTSLPVLRVSKSSSSAVVEVAEGEEDQPRVAQEVEVVEAQLRFWNYLLRTSPVA